MHALLEERRSNLAQGMASTQESINIVQQQFSFWDKSQFFWRMP
jgi:hypothetical protein